MKVNIEKTYKYSPNGFEVVECEPGEHDIPDDFAQSAVKNKYGTFIKEKKEKKPKNNKAMQPEKNKTDD